jgi:hypothetical protein
MAVRTIDTACDFSLAPAMGTTATPHNQNPDMQDSKNLTYNIWDRGILGAANVQ